MAPSAFITSLRNMLLEYGIRNTHRENPALLLNHWSFEEEAKSAWDNFYTLPDQMLNQGTQTPWAHEAFLALPQLGTQNKLQRMYSEAKLSNLLSSVAPRKAIKILSSTGLGLQLSSHQYAAYLDTLYPTPSSKVRSKYAMVPEFTLTYHTPASVEHNWPGR